MLKRLRAKHPVGFCVLSEVLFLGSLLLASYLVVFALVLFGVDLERVDSYFLSAVQETVGMVVALVILGRTGKMYLLRRRGSGFFNGRNDHDGRCRYISGAGTSITVPIGTLFGSVMTALLYSYRYTQNNLLP